MKMTTRRLVLLALFASAITGEGVAQNASYERILLPIVLSVPAPGAYGSVWMTEVNARAIGSTATFREFFACQACLPNFEIASGTTVDITTALFKGADGPPGSLVYLRQGGSGNVELNIRLIDTSRRSLTWGTEIPVVRERDFHTLPLTLIAVPTDSAFREALRIYDVDAALDTTFRIEISDEASGERLVDEIRAVQTSPLSGGEFAFVPTVVEIQSITAIYPQLRTAQRVAITVTPVRPATRFWAFVSVTNNDTQQVTTITPHE